MSDIIVLLLQNFSMNQLNLLSYKSFYWELMQYIIMNRSHIIKLPLLKLLITKLINTIFQEGPPPNVGYFPTDSLSSFGSVSIPSDTLRGGGDNSIVDDRTEVVTSRLGGRRSAASSRAPSSIMSEEGTLIKSDNIH